MANNRMWLVHDEARARLLLAKHNGEDWCWVHSVDLPDYQHRTGWRIAYEGDNWTQYDNVATADGTDGYTACQP